MCFKLRKKSCLRPKLYHRLFWTIVTIVSAWNIMSIFLHLLSNYLLDSISIGIDTSYLRWSSTFPAVSICLTKSRSNNKVLQYLRRENIVGLKPNGSMVNFSKTIHEYMFSNPNNINFKDEYCKGLNTTCGVDVLRLRQELLPTNCSEFMVSVSFLDSSFSRCDDAFHFHELEMGYCFLANNLLDYGAADELPLKFDLSHRERSLKVFLKGGFPWNYELYVHSSEDLPYFNSISYDVLTDPAIYRFNILEYDNDEDVIREPVKQRKCLFPGERGQQSSSPHYSFSSCMSQYRIQFELEECNCTHFTSPQEYMSRYCDIKGLKCLSKAEIQTKTKETVIKRNLCFPSCVEQQVTFVGSNEINGLSTNGLFYVEVEITDLPTVRLNRVVTDTYLDLVVSVGGVFGLFAGASFLNVVEIIYLVLRKKPK